MFRTKSFGHDSVCLLSSASPALSLLSLSLSTSFSSSLSLGRAKFTRAAIRRGVYHKHTRGVEVIKSFVHWWTSCLDTAALLVTLSGTSRRRWRETLNAAIAVDAEIVFREDITRIQQITAHSNLAGRILKTYRICGQTRYAPRPSERFTWI